MDHVSGFFTNLISNYPLLTYPGLFISIILLGNPVSFSTFWLAFQEEFRFSTIALLFAFIVFTDICGDLAWYYMGKKLRGTRLGEKLHSKIPKAEIVAAHLKRHDSKWVFLSKYIPSSTFTIIFSAGWTDMPFKKFIRTSLVAILSSVLLIAGITYGLSLGFSAIEAKNIFHRIEQLLVVGLLAFLLINFIFGKLITRYFRREERQDTTN
jgi:membrane protein DedA with SNARE-associated domain